MNHFKSLMVFLALLITNNVMATSDPALIFPLTNNQLKPSSYWPKKGPYETNAWFINFALTRPQNWSYPVNAFPYLIKAGPKGIALSYSAANFYIEPAYPAITAGIFYQFDEQFTLGALENMTYRGVSDYHGLMANLNWSNKNHQQISAPILQGSPYLTQFFIQATPMLTSRYKWMSVNGQKQIQPLTEAQRFEVVLALNDKHTQTWILYSEKPIKLIWTTNSEGEKLVAQNSYTGWIRIILQKDEAQKIDNSKRILDEYSTNIPLDYKQNYFFTNKNLIYSFSWITQNKLPPLMLSLPHQKIQWGINKKVKYVGIKGLMYGVNQLVWNMELPVIPVFFLEYKDLNLSEKNVLKQSLQQEAKQFINEALPSNREGPYFTGKRLARAARLTLIADFLNDTMIKKNLLAYIKSALEKFMKNKAAWRFEYDSIWGGIIPSINDSGARHYNDHHYHYGYWVYAFAVVAKYDKTWLNTTLESHSFSPKEWIYHLILDYANPWSNHPYYPLKRYQDDYAGHSWALGLTANADGQDEQSSSEAVNAYYAVALYAKAIQDTRLYEWGRFLMTRELISAQTYWQIRKGSTIYPAEFTKDNQVIGNLWASKVDANTFFIPCVTEYRCGLQYAYGIQMLPFTGISSYLLNTQWLENAKSTLEKLINGQYGQIIPAWRWILVKGISPILNAKERMLYFNQAVHSKPSDYDNGDSRTNTLFFLSQ